MAFFFPYGDTALSVGSESLAIYISELVSLRTGTGELFQ